MAVVVVDVVDVDIDDVVGREWTFRLLFQWMEYSRKRKKNKKRKMEEKAKDLAFWFQQEVLLEL